MVWWSGTAAFFILQLMYSTPSAHVNFMTAPFFRQEVDFPCIKQAVLLMGGEKNISLPFLLAVQWQEEL